MSEPPPLTPEIAISLLGHNSDHLARPGETMNHGKHLQTIWQLGGANRFVRGDQ